MADPYNLQRFVDAQAPTYMQVCAELRAGRKKSHWMWFIFPQITGLGHSDMARRFAISSRAEAEAYLAHEILGPRLEDCTRLVNQIDGCTAHEIFGSPDDLKFRSSMSLFAAVSSRASVFNSALQKYFGGQADPITLGRL